MISSCSFLASFQLPPIDKCALPILSLVVGVAAIALAQAQIIPYPCTYAGATVISVTFVLCATKIALQSCKRNSVFGQEIVVRKKEVKQTPGAWPDELADEVLLNIFHHLSLLDLARASLVCRRWYQIIQDPSFLPFLTSIGWHGKEYSLSRALSAHYSLGAHHHPVAGSSYLIMSDFELFSGNRWLRVWRTPFSNENFSAELVIAKGEQGQFTRKKIFFKGELSSINGAVVESNSLYFRSEDQVITIFDLETGDKADTFPMPHPAFGSNLFITDRDIIFHGKQIVWVTSKQNYNESYCLSCPVQGDVNQILSWGNVLILNESSQSFFIGDRSKIVVWHYQEQWEEIIYSGPRIEHIALSGSTLMMQQGEKVKFYNLENKQWLADLSLKQGQKLIGAFGGVLVLQQGAQLTTLDYRPSLVIPHLKILDENLLLNVFRFFDPTTLSRAALVCRKWRILAQDPLLLTFLLPAMNWYGEERNPLKALAAYNALGTHDHPRFMTQQPTEGLNFFSGNRWFSLTREREGFFKIAVRTFTSDYDQPLPEYFSLSWEKAIWLTAAIDGDHIYASFRGSIRCFNLGNEAAVHTAPGEIDFRIDSLFVANDQLMAFGYKGRNESGLLRAFSKDLSYQYEIDCPQFQDFALKGALGYKDSLILLYLNTLKKYQHSKIIIWNRFENAQEEIYNGEWVSSIYLSEITLILEQGKNYGFYNLETRAWFKSHSRGRFVGAAGGILFVDTTESELLLYDYRNHPSQTLVGE